jgi:hypothetical protein
MDFEAYTVNDPKYTGSDAVVFIETSMRFHPIYCQSNLWEMQIKEIAKSSVLGFFYINTKFCTDFVSKIANELNNRGRKQIKPILKEIFEIPELD